MQNIKKRKKKKVQMNVFTKQKETLRLQKQTYGYQNGKVGGRGGKDKCFRLTHTHYYI